MSPKQNIYIDFYKSLFSEGNTEMSLPKVLEWLELKRKNIRANISQTLFSKVKEWTFDKNSGNLQHVTGKFFSIEGIRIKMNSSYGQIWEQPIIMQQEVGLLGFITKKFNGILHFLVQAKTEPGNINKIQLSPTIQATESNYSLVHKGRKPYYLEYFNGEKKVKVLTDQLQSEQGARFYRKRNRNIIVEITDDIPLYDDFCWLTLGQIKQLLRLDNIVNMDARSVISCIHFTQFDNAALHLSDIFPKNQIADTLFSRDLFISEKTLNSSKKIISWISELKKHYKLEVDFIGLKNIKNWCLDDKEIYHELHKYFSIIAVDVEIENREISHWMQPMVKPAQEGIVAFIIKKFDNIYHFLVQAKLEAGNCDVLELAPTVQCLTGNYRQGLNEYEVPFLNEVLNAPPDSILYKTFQSEEGGRFYKEQNLHMIVDVSDDFDSEVPENYCWMTLNQLQIFNTFNNYLNIQARSLLSVMPL